jgi:O-antigen/teichoic acid export membrane protein
MKISSLLKDTFVYGITRYLSLFSALLLTPLYTRYFLKSEYGVLDIFNTWVGFASVIVPLGLIASILRLLPESKKNIKYNIYSPCSTKCYLFNFYVFF